MKFGRKQAHIKEIQVNGGSTADKVECRKGVLDQEVKVAGVFAQDEMVDIGGATKGKGFSGVITRWGCTQLARKSQGWQRKPRRRRRPSEGEGTRSADKAKRWCSLKRLAEQKKQIPPKWATWPR